MFSLDLAVMSPVLPPASCLDMFGIILTVSGFSSSVRIGISSDNDSGDILCV